jgi:hypothetical protein
MIAHGMYQTPSKRVRELQVDRERERETRAKGVQVVGDAAYEG